MIGPRGAISLAPHHLQLQNPESHGILYRPELTYTLAFYRRRDPGSGEPWRLYRSMQVQLPNQAVTVSANVDRSFFMERYGKLSFSDGVLTEACLQKPSEAAAAAAVPLKIVVSLPVLASAISFAAIRDRPTRSMADSLEHS